MKIVLRVVGSLSIAVGLFWFGQGMGLLAGPHNAVLIDAGAGVVALGIGLVWFALIAVAQDSLAPIGRPEQPRRNRTHQRAS